MFFSIFMAISLLTGARAGAQIEEVVIAGDHFETASGQPFCIHGLEHSNYWYGGGGNLGDRARSFYDLGAEAWFSFADARAMKQWYGLNCIRYRFSNGDMADTDEVARVMRIVRACSQAGVYVILGANQPSWNDAGISSWAQMWGGIAALTSGVNGVLGYDLANEPYPPSEAMYIQACNAAKDAIRAVSQKAIFYAWPFGGVDMPSVSHSNPGADILDPQAALTAHFYSPVDWSHCRIEGTYPGVIAGRYYDKEVLRDDMRRRWRSYLDENGPMPIWIGECGARPCASGYLAWISDAFAVIAEDWGDNWSFFRAKNRKWDSPWGIALPPYPVTTDAVLRPLVEDPTHEFVPQDFDFMRSWSLTIDYDVLNTLSQ
jgi:hypothetical protein